MPALGEAEAVRPVGVDGSDVAEPKGPEKKTQGPRNELTPASLKYTTPGWTESCADVPVPV
ncbi:hypothetical protein D3C71_2037940 [compost metagenome]